MPSSKETYQGSLTRGMVNPNDSRADMVFHVTGLDGTRTNLDDAIDTVTAGNAWAVHPDDTTIPLRTASARWHRGADNGSNAEALVFLSFDKRGSGRATDGTEFSNVANVRVRYETIEWWSPTLDTALPHTIVSQPDPEAGNAAVLLPRPKLIEVPIMDIQVPVVLSTSPIGTIEPTVGKTNSSALTLSGESFSSNTIRNNGIEQNAVRIDNGSSVTYEFDVRYSFSIRRDGWRRSILENNAGEYRANVEDIYERAAFPTFPT